MCVCVEGAGVRIGERSHGTRVGGSLISFRNAGRPSVTLIATKVCETAWPFAQAKYQRRFLRTLSILLCFFGGKEIVNNVPLILRGEIYRLKLKIFVFFAVLFGSHPGFRV